MKERVNKGRRFFNAFKTNFLNKRSQKPKEAKVSEEITQSKTYTKLEMKTDDKNSAERRTNVAQTRTVNG